MPVTHPAQPVMIRKMSQDIEQPPLEANLPLVEKSLGLSDKT